MEWWAWVIIAAIGAFTLLRVLAMLIFLSVVRSTTKRIRQ